MPYRESSESWPQAVRAQLEELQRGLLDVLSENLVGIYLHGSLAMGCFNPRRSDLDLLVVTKHPMSVETKHQIAELLLRVSSQRRPIEISFLSERDLHPWQYPTPFDFHYGEAHRGEFEGALQSGRWRTWNDHRPTDPDLAAHITVTRERGICLCGRPIAEAFPEVPKAHYRDSIAKDFYWAKERLGENPVYSILNACRVYAYLREDRITSKTEAGEWAASALPEKFHEIVTAALELYRGDYEEVEFDPKALDEFSEYIEQQMEALLAPSGEEHEEG